MATYNRPSKQPSKRCGAWYDRELNWENSIGLSDGRGEVQSGRYIYCFKLEFTLASPAFITFIKSETFHVYINENTITEEEKLTQDLRKVSQKSPPHPL